MDFGTGTRLVSNSLAKTCNNNTTHAAGHDLQGHSNLMRVEQCTLFHLAPRLYGWQLHVQRRSDRRIINETATVCVCVFWPGPHATSSRRQTPPGCRARKLSATGVVSSNVKTTTSQRPSPMRENSSAKRVFRSVVNGILTLCFDVLVDCVPPHVVSLVPFNSLGAETGHNETPVSKGSRPSPE